MTAPLGTAAVERFTRDWYAATGSGCADRALIALSGGPDSTALLLLITAIQSSINPSAAATVDHGLRAASSAEAGRAADIARRFGISHTILRGDLPARVDRTANVSARARAMRYALLAEHADDIGARWIVTAHHQDDQLETMLMRLNRGAGVRGLSGIRRVSERIVRPLLGWRHAELAQLVEEAGIAAVNDPSNVDDRFDRARLRKSLGSADWLDTGGFTRSAAALADADEAIEWATDQAERANCTLSPGMAIIRHFFLPAEVKRRLVERCLRHSGYIGEIPGRDLSGLMERLAAGADATLGGVKVGHVLVSVDGLPASGWCFTLAPPRRPAKSTT